MNCVFMQYSEANVAIEISARACGFALRQVNHGRRQDLALGRLVAHREDDAAKARFSVAANLKPAAWRRCSTTGSNVVRYSADSVRAG